MSLLQSIQIKFREETNPYLGPLRRKVLEKADKDKFTIISNNCWGGHLYLSLIHI